MENENATQTLRDWTKEAKEVEDVSNRNYFKAEADQEYIITFLDEGSQEYTRVFEDREITQIDFKIKAIDEQNNTNEYIWTLTKGGKDSCYGKLVTIFATKGKSTGVTVLLTAVGDGKNRRYLVKLPREGGLQ